MKFIYPAVFRKTEAGTYRAFFPDLECCYAEGDTLDEAIDRANDAAYDWISWSFPRKTVSFRPFQMKTIWSSWKVILSGIFP